MLNPQAFWALAWKQGLRVPITWGKEARKRTIQDKESESQTQDLMPGIRVGLPWPWKGMGLGEEWWGIPNKLWPKSMWLQLLGSYGHKEIGGHRSSLLNKNGNQPPTGSHLNLHCDSITEEIRSSLYYVNLVRQRDLSTQNETANYIPKHKKESEQSQ